MLISTDYIVPAELTGYVRAALADMEINRFILSEYLPSRPIDDLQYRFARGGIGFTDVAQYRAFDAEASIAKRPGIQRVTGDLPPVSRKIRLGEYERLRQRHLPDQIVEAVYNDADLMVSAVAGRLELARGSALSLAQVTISEDGVIATVDFGRLGAHTNQAPGVLWSTTASSTPISDMLAWQATYQSNNGGQKPGSILTSTQALNYVLRSQEVRGLAAQQGVTPNIVSQFVLNTILAAYGLPPVVVYDAQLSVAGTVQRVIPANNVLLLPPAGEEDLGSTFWGTTAESLQPEYELEGDEPGIVAGVYDTKDPVALWTKATGIALPVLANPNLTFQAVVF